MSKKGPTNILQARQARARNQLAARLGVKVEDLPRDLDASKGDGIMLGREGDKIVVKWRKPATALSFSLAEAAAFASAIQNSVAKHTLAGPGISSEESNRCPTCHNSGVLLFRRQ